MPVLRRSLGSVSCITDKVIDDEDDIGWHWDKDYGMERMGINVHPCVATVTYLSQNGGPTVILDKTVRLGSQFCADSRAVRQGITIPATVERWA